MQTKVMRTIRVVIALSLVGLLMVVSAGARSPQPQFVLGADWTKYSGNPVLEPSLAGGWNAYMVLEPCVIRDGGTYKMWYAGQSAPGSQGWHLGIGYAVSTNGIDWEKYGNPVLGRGVPGAWDYENVSGAYVMFHDGIYKMWYHGGVGGVGGTEQIGYATSSDEVKWTKHPGNPILPVTPGAWDGQKVIDPCVIRWGSIYEMWYSGLGPDGKFRLGHATSSDGVNWTKHAANPVMDVGPAGSFDSDGVRDPSVLYDNVSYVYRMWYTGIDSNGHYRLGYATSYDGLDWTKYSGNPILEPGPTGSWDADMAALAEVIHDGGTYKMWYTGQNFGVFSIGHALPNNIILNPETGETYTTIQGAIDDADPGQQVLASAGFYQENITLTVRVSVQGSGADRTILEGTGAGPTVRVLDGGIDPSIVIAGFRIIGGSSSSGVSAQAGGGGVHISGASPSIINNVIEGNTATTGGGIYVDNGDPTISNTIIQSNNANDGGGIYVNSGNPTISNNTIQDNNASSDGGGIYVNSDNPDISNNTVQGNDANSGGGVYVNSDNSAISNNTIQGNNSNADGGGVYVGSTAAPLIHSNTLCGNANFNLYKNGGGTLDARGNWWGANTPISGTDYNAYVSPDPVVTASLEAVPAVKLLRWGTVTVTLRSGVYHAADGTAITLTVQGDEGRFWDDGPGVVVSTTSGLASTRMTPLVVGPIEVSAFSGCSGQELDSVMVTGESAEVNLPTIMKEL